MALLLLAMLASSCAYYNTFYLSRKYYDKATGGMPYSIEKPQPTMVQNYSKAIDYAKKVLANYPKSKWVDDAYVMWAKSLLGRDDPMQTVNMLRDFNTRYPKSTLKHEAQFYLGVGFRQARKYPDAVRELEGFLAAAPKHDLAPYGYLELSRALMSQQRPAEAADAANQLLTRFPKSKLEQQGLIARAEARLANGDYSGARSDFGGLGVLARTDDERFNYLLREADCLEGGRDYAGELALLNDAISHEQRPVEADTGRVVPNRPPGADRWGRLRMRIATVHALEERLPLAVAGYKDVLLYYSRTPLAGEAQYRLAYAYETVADDFETARVEYGKVKSLGSSAFASQAQQRLTSLDRLARYRSAGEDTLDKKVEADFLLAEQYLFQLQRPERALAQYQLIAATYPETPYALKATNAAAWVLRRKMDQSARADSMLWAVVRGHPGTEAQLAARDYLEAAGHEVPADLIRLPEKLLAVDSLQADPGLAQELTPIPQGTMPFMIGGFAVDPTQLAPKPTSPSLVAPPPPPLPPPSAGGYPSMLYPGGQAPPGGTSPPAASSTSPSTTSPPRASARPDSSAAPRDTSGGKP